MRLLQCEHIELPFAWDRTLPSSYGGAHPLAGQPLTDQAIWTWRRDDQTTMQFEVAELHPASIDIEAPRLGQESRRAGAAVNPAATTAHAATSSGVLYLVMQRNTTSEGVSPGWSQLRRSVERQSERPLKALNALEKLLRELDPQGREERDEYLEALRRGASRLDEISRQLQELSRIEDGTSNTAPERFLWRAFVEELAEQIAPAAERRSVQLEVKHLEGHDVPVEGHRPVLLSTVAQLVLDCLKSAVPGARLLLESRKDDDTVVLAIRMQAADAAATEEASRREKVATTEHAAAWKSQHEGLSWPLAKHVLCDLHAGSLTMERRRADAARLRITLPAVLDAE